MNIMVCILNYLGWQYLKSGRQLDEIKHRYFQIDTVINTFHQQLKRNIIVALQHIYYGDST